MTAFTGGFSAANLQQIDPVHNGHRVTAMQDGPPRSLDLRKCAETRDAALLRIRIIRADSRQTTPRCSMTRKPPWYARLMKVCQRLGRSPEEAEDLVQDAYVRFLEYRQGNQIRNEESLLSQIV